jgi:hypothetical protein
MLQGHLYGQDFLKEAIQLMPEWQSVSEADVAVFSERLRAIAEQFSRSRNPNESVTEAEAVYPLIRLLGWEYLPQQSSAIKGRSEVPDALLFADIAAKAILGD